jgi:hypothetical protein
MPRSPGSARPSAAPSCRERQRFPWPSVSCCKCADPQHRSRHSDGRAPCWPSPPSPCACRSHEPSVARWRALPAHGDSTHAGHGQACVSGATFAYVGRQSNRTGAAAALSTTPRILRCRGQRPPPCRCREQGPVPGSRRTRHATSRCDPALPGRTWKREWLGTSEISPSRPSVHVPRRRGATDGARRGASPRRSGIPHCARPSARKAAQLGCLGQRRRPSPGRSPAVPVAVPSGILRPATNDASAPV